MHKRTYTSENDSPEDKVDLSNDTLEEITKVENVANLIHVGCRQPANNENGTE